MDLPTGLPPGAPPLALLLSMDPPANLPLWTSRRVCLQGLPPWPCFFPWTPRPISPYGPPDGFASRGSPLGPASFHGPPGQSPLMDLPTGLPPGAPPLALLLSMDPPANLPLW